MLSSADFDAASLLTVVLWGDGRLPELLRQDDLYHLHENPHAADDGARPARGTLELLRHALRRPATPRL